MRHCDVVTSNTSISCPIDATGRTKQYQVYIDRKHLNGFFQMRKFAAEMYRLERVELSQSFFSTNLWEQRDAGGST